MHKSFLNTYYALGDVLSLEKQQGTKREDYILIRETVRNMNKEILSCIRKNVVP